jgi:hypothetical protein
MSFTINGVVEKRNHKEKQRNREAYARLYQIKVETMGGFKKFINIDDFDLNRKIEVGQEVKLPIYCDIWQPKSKDGILKPPVIQYHAIKEDNAKVMPVKGLKA